MKRFALSNVLPLAAASLMMFAAAGCGRDGVKVYHVDTNDTTTPLPPAAGTTTMPSAMPAGLPVPDRSNQPALKYTLPAGWQEKPASEMRVASFNVPGDGKEADVSVIPLGGMAGGDFANVNRWLGQVGQKPITEDQLPKLAEKVEVAGQPADLYDLAGASLGSGDAERILATILHRDDTAWFFKMTGESDLVEKNKPAFIAFLKSVEFIGQPAPAAMDMNMSQLPPSHPPIAGMSLGSQNSLIPSPNQTVIGGFNSGGNDKPTWTVPAGWQPGPLEQFLVAKYIIAGTGDLKAEVNVSSLAGDGGGLLANVNHWRAQLGQPPVTEADITSLPTIDISGSKATEVDISGKDPRTGKATELVGVVFPLGDQTWFYKLMGDVDVVAQQKEALVKFVESAKYP